MKKAIIVFFALVSVLVSSAQQKRTDANIVGHVVSEGEHIPFATVLLKGTTIGVATDETGHFQMINMPEGPYILKVQAVGFKALERDVQLVKGKTIEIKFELEPDVLGLEEVVVTANRNEKTRKDASVIVNTLTPKMFETTQAIALNESLNFSPGVRMESNCSNCGFTQVRMNGMEGPYSQILINNRAIFSGLAGVYGLELIPSNMIERVEVVRGGGSALYGSNAIAGTINLILKDPINNSYEVGLTDGVVGLGRSEGGDIANDFSMNFNTSLVSHDSQTGMSLYGFYRDRDPYDANGDDFSELTSINNATVGTRVFHRFGTRSKISADFFTINEKRRGGNKFDEVEHMADIAESVAHNITSGAVTFEQFFRKQDKWSIFVSGQNVKRDSYYGAEQSLSDYGKTNGFTYTAGTQYNLVAGNANITMGVENRSEWLEDNKMGYADIDGAYFEIVDGEQELVVPYVENTLIADQFTNTLGAYAQYEQQFNKFNVSLGARYDNYLIEDKDQGDKKTGNVLSPRLTLKYDIFEYLQARASYSQGYRAPQVFDEDLHIASSGARKIIHKNDEDLVQETSHSYMASLDFNKKIGSVYTGLLVEGFYTQLNDAFVNDHGEPNEDGVITYIRKNAEGGASVKGINVELNLVPSKKFSFKSGFTIQRSMYEEAQDFNEKHFLRTPDTYGFIAVDYDIADFCISASGSYTGNMLVPYFGVIENAEGVMVDNIKLNRDSGDFFDLGLKVRYSTRLNGAKLQVFCGVKNLFDSYQKDHDLGVNKDPGYIYGPSAPRTVYAGLKIGNMLD
jgi:outer membrane receptor for ferrienterochelin and colicins